MITLDPAIQINGEHSTYLDDFIETGGQLALDDKLDAALESARPDDIFTLIYTSGTTGSPKGAIAIP